MYGSSTPPLINLSNIKDVPVAMFVGAEDSLADPMDTAWAKDQIGSAVIHYEVIPDYDHGSFTMGVKMDYMNTVKDLLKKYN